MKLLITGATGFVGRALVMRLLQEGHSPLALVRNVEKARQVLGSEISLVSYDQGQEKIVETISRVHTVINLAGAPILPKRWTSRRKQELIDSRVGVTRRLVEAIGKASPRPEVLVSASAVGYYGSSDRDEFTETSQAGEGFLARLCVDWEEAARSVQKYGARLVITRFGMVVGLGGGVLQSMLPIFQKGLGGPLGNGKQILSWIHLEDLLEVLLAPLTDQSMKGVYNATSPNPVSSKEFSSILGEVLGKPSRFKVPGFITRTALGEAATALLTGQRAIPQRLVEQGFRFKYQDLRKALPQILNFNAPVKVSAGLNK